MKVYCILLKLENVEKKRNISNFCCEDVKEQNRMIELNGKVEKKKKKDKLNYPFMKINK